MGRHLATQTRKEIRQWSWLLDKRLADLGKPRSKARDAGTGVVIRITIGHDMEAGLQ